MKKEFVPMELFDPQTMTADQIMDAMEPARRNEPRVWPSFLAELVDVLADHYESREKMEPARAMEQAEKTIVVISHHLGGRNLYLPRDDRLKRAIRDAAIYRGFDGSNHLELSEKTRLTPAQIYNIIGKQRKLRQKPSGSVM